MAVIAALDAQEMLPALSTFIVQAKSTPGLTDECQTPLRLVVSSGLYAMVWNKNKKGLGIYKGWERTIVPEHNLDPQLNTTVSWRFGFCMFCRKWNLIYERLEMGVFKLAEELDVDADTVEQVNFYILFLNR
jgi:hypothetical protein